MHAFLLIALFAQNIPAGEALPRTEPLVLSLEECVTLALRTAESNKWVSAALMAARADAERAHAESLPHLNVTPGIRAYEQSGSTRPSIELDFGEHFLEVPQNAVRKRIARGRVELEQKKRHRALQQVGLNARRTYFHCLRAEAQRELARESLDAASRVAARWDHVAKHNAAIEEQRQQCVLQRERARLARESADAALKEAQRTLRALCGLPADRAIQLEDLPDYQMPDIRLGQCQEWAARHSTELQASGKELELAEEAIRLARLMNYPQPQLSLGYREGEEDESLDSTTTEEGAYATFSLRIPLWDAGTKAAFVSQAKARREAVSAGAKKRQSTLFQAVASHYLALREAIALRRAAQANRKHQDAFEKLGVQQKYGAASRAALEEARIKHLEHETHLLLSDLDCYEREADLLAILEATPQEWQRGLTAPGPQPAPPNTEEKATIPDAD
jgi:outer membrane protein TolC